MSPAYVRKRSALSITSAFFSVIQPLGFVTQAAWDNVVLTP